MPDHHAPGKSANDIPYAVSTDCSLKKALGPDTDLKKLFTIDKIREAQSLFDEANMRFAREAQAQADEIHQLYCQMNCDTLLAPEHTRRIHQLTHLFKGRMEALGYHFCYHIAHSLHGYCANLTSYSQSHLMVIAKHIHALQAALRENQGGDGGTSGKEMVEMLAQLVQKVRAAG